MTRVESINFLLSSGLRSEQIKEVLEPFTHEEAMKEKADIIIYIQVAKNYDALYLAEYLNASIYDCSAVDDYNIFLLKDLEADNED